MFRRPDSDDEDDYRPPKRASIQERRAAERDLLSKKKFVPSSDPQENFKDRNVDSVEEAPRGLSEDEKNKLNARLLKAEMKGDAEAVKKIKRKLAENTSSAASSSQDTVVLMKRDRSGNVVPATKRTAPCEQAAQSSARMRNELERECDFETMLRDEKLTSPADQLLMFQKNIVKSAKIRRHDDESIDDIAEMQREKSGSRKKKHDSEKRKMEKEHNFLLRSLDDCVRCFESPRLQKQCIVAVGLTTYLCVVPWDGIDEEHCLIVPQGHASSSIQLDENVYEEMRLWRKGLTAMWRADGRDCVFMETARDVKSNNHMHIECIPLPEEVGDMAPIYFQKAINECEGEYADNKKLIDIKDIRKQIPKGFPYFAVDFGMQNGYAHVIEDCATFSPFFGAEIVVGMLDLPHAKYRKQSEEPFDKQKKKCDHFKKIWEKYDWTKSINR